MIIKILLLSSVLSLALPGKIFRFLITLQQPSASNCVVKALEPTLMFQESSAYDWLPSPLLLPKSVSWSYQISIFLPLVYLSSLKYNTNDNKIVIRHKVPEIMRRCLYLNTKQQG